MKPKSKILFMTLLMVLLLIVSIFIIGVAIIKCILPTPLSEQQVKKDFMENQVSIFIVTDYLKNSNYSDIYINDTEPIGMMFAGLDVGDVVINDPKVVQALEDLLINKGYNVIVKSGSTIHLQRSTRFRDFSNGVAYSIDGSELDIEFLTYINPLVDGWYYYESDFNEYKKRKG